MPPNNIKLLVNEFASTGSSLNASEGFFNTSYFMLYTRDKKRMHFSRLPTASSCAAHKLHIYRCDADTLFHCHIHIVATPHSPTSYGRA